MLEQYFTPLSYSVDIGTLLALLGAFFAIAGWFKKVFSVTGSPLQVTEVSVEKILNKPNEFTNDLKVYLNGNEIEQLSRIVIYLRNFGGKTLNVGNYHALPRIDLNGFTNIISLNISTSNQYTTCVVNRINATQVDLEVNSLEAQDFVRIEILFESIMEDYSPSFTFHLKEHKLRESNLKNFKIDKWLGWKNDSNVFYMIPFLIGVPVYWYTYLVVKYGFRVDFSKEISIGWNIVFYIPAILICIYVIAKFWSSVNDWHDGHKNVSTWHNVTQ